MDVGRPEKSANSHDLSLQESADLLKVGRHTVADAKLIENMQKRQSSEFRKTFSPLLYNRILHDYSPLCIRWLAKGFNLP
jgi:hypothetical protein